MTDKEEKLVKNARMMKSYCQRKYKEGCDGCVLMGIIDCDSCLYAPKDWWFRD